MKRIEPKIADRPNQRMVTSTSITPEMDAKLVEESQRTGYNRATLLRKIIEAYFEESE